MSLLQKPIMPTWPDRMLGWLIYGVIGIWLVCWAMAAGAQVVRPRGAWLIACGVVVMLGLRLLYEVTR